MKLPTVTIAPLALLAAVAAPTAHGMFRFDCFNNLVVDRVDPIVNPGVASGHLHAISGGNGFSKSADGAAMKASTCTSCPIGADLSAYWVPQMYVKFKNGTGYGLVESHQIVYYEPRPTGNETVIPFPDGLKMLAGNPKLREAGDSIEQRAITWVCIDYDNSHPEQQGIPNFKCPDGLRGQVNFPMCWDGVNTDSDDHKSHVAYATDLDGGSCPDGWQKMVKIFYEAFYSVDKYDDEWDGDQHPFVLSNGDRTGYGFHGDFLDGWDKDVLRDAIDQCTDENYFNSGECPPLTASFSSDAPEEKCVNEPEIVEDISPVTALPGNNPVDGDTVASTAGSSSSTATETPSVAASVSGSAASVGSGSAGDAAASATSAPAQSSDGASVGGEADALTPTPETPATSAAPEVTSEAPTSTPETTLAPTPTGAGLILGNPPEETKPICRSRPKMPPFRRVQVHTWSTNFRAATEIVEVAKLPTPAAGNVVVKNHFLGINATDINITNGGYGRTTLPINCGLEAGQWDLYVGVVTSVGEGVTSAKVNDYVAFQHLGAFAEYTEVPATKLIQTPELSPAVIPLTVCGVSASLALEKAGDMKTNETVFVSAAAGATGQFVAQLAKLAGNHVIGACSSDEKVAYLKSLGVDRPINYKKEDLSAVLKAEYPDGINLAFESVGGELFKAVLDNIAVLGRIIVFGNVSHYHGDSGPEPQYGYQQNRKMQLRSASLRGFLLFHHAKDVPEHLERLLKLIKEGKLKAGIDPTEFRGLESIPDAIDRLYAQKNIGKLVIRL
ncbi:hypothetical protein BBJ28_00019693 [Nothophytophthora sp. Chile5]|nr:hypothetical protein BBJ28_00019693 [Nothophytophthora sp. Chile5]